MNLQMLDSIITQFQDYCLMMLRSFAKKLVETWLSFLTEKPTSGLDICLEVKTRFGSATLVKTMVRIGSGKTTTDWSSPILTDIIKITNIKLQEDPEIFVQWATEIEMVRGPVLAAKINI